MLAFEGLGGLDHPAIARGARPAAVARPALCVASAAAVGIRAQRPCRYRGHRLSAAGVPGDRAALPDPCRRRARRRRAGQVFSRRRGPRALQALGLAPADRLRSPRSPFSTCPISAPARRCSDSSASMSAKRASTRVPGFSCGSCSARSSRCAARHLHSTFPLPRWSWRRSRSSSSCASKDRAPTSPAPCCSPSLSLSCSRRTTPGTSRGWCRSCASIPSSACVYLTCAASYLYFAHWPPSVSDGLVIYGPCVLILIAEFAYRRRRKPEERHGDTVPA